MESLKIKIAEKGSLEFRKWLEKEFAAGPENWSDEFLSYIEKRTPGPKLSGGIDHKKVKTYSSREADHERNLEASYRRYLSMLDLKPTELAGKKILDLGCGGGEFISSCLSKGITNEAYGVNYNLDKLNVASDQKRNFMQANFLKPLAIGNIDLAVSVGAISLHLENPKLKKIIENAIGTVKNGGELRIAPIYKAMRGELEYVIENEKALLAVLEKLKSELGISWELRPLDILVRKKEKDVMMTNVLIIKKQGVNN